MKTTLKTSTMNVLLAGLKKANTEVAQIYPGDHPDRQPVHTVYGGAHLFKSNTIPKIGELALHSFREYAPDAKTLAKALHLPKDESYWQTIHDRVDAKLQREAVEDFRIDFEDGFGVRPDQEEDEAAIQAAKEVAAAMKAKTLSPFIGIRVKPLTEDLKARSFRTLDLFLTTLLTATKKSLPENFVITLPKITHPYQVSAFVNALDHFEEAIPLKPKSLKIELMVETTQSIFDSSRKAALLEWVKLAEGRCRGAHFGTYDYTASHDITAKYQAMDHQACDFARQMMKTTLARTGVWLSDGATNVMPVGPHKNPKTEAEKRENQAVIHRAWKLSFDHISNSLRNALYQGWDLHPAQFPIRYAACFHFFLEGYDEAANRLRNFIDQAAKATLVGDIFDDAATGQGLLNFFLRALNSGAISAEDLRSTGLSLKEIQTRSFLKILDMRRK